MGLQIDPQRTRYTEFVIALVAFVVVLFLIAPLIWSMLQIFIIAALITLALDAPVHWQAARGVPRWAATLNILFLLIAILVAIVSFLIPPVVAQSREFLALAPVLWAQLIGQLSILLHRFPQISQAFDPSRFLSDLLTGAGSLILTARSIFATAFGAVTVTILILVTVFYALLNPWPLLYGLRGIFPSEWWGTVDRIAAMIAARIRAWVVGTFVLAIIIGVLDYLALLLIDAFFPQRMPFILFFAILGGVLEVIPVIGPIIASVLPALVGFSLNPLMGLLIILAFFVIQQLEANLLTPYVMNKAVCLHPVSLLVALVLLSGLFGLFGALIAVPVASVLKVLYDEWYYPLTHQDKHPQPPPKEPAGEKS